MYLLTHNIPAPGRFHCLASGGVSTMALHHPRTIAYLRVSTHEQDVVKNQADILLLAHRQHLGQVEFVEETVSSRVPWRRRKIAQVLDTLEAGDTLVVSELSRLGRSNQWC